MKWNFDNKPIAFFVLSSFIIFENNKDKIEKKDHNNPVFPVLLTEKIDID
jgi:hypothetical protein